MILLLLLGFVCIGTALALLAISLQPKQSGVARSLAVLEALADAPKELTDELTPSFADRIIEPLRDRALKLGRRIGGSDSAERVRRKLDLAGNPAGWTVDRYVSGKVLAAGLGLLFGGGFAIMLGFAMMTAFLTAILGAAVGFFAPDLFLYQRTYERTDKMKGALADAIDLMTISVEAGLGFDAAVQQVSLNTEGPLAEEFARMLREMQLGAGRSEALRGLGERTNLDDVRSFVSAMVQADSFGIPVGQVLRVQASEMRIKKRQWAETKAQQVPVKITIPLIFCILPCLFVMIMGPAALRIMDSF
ncbi:type II secretion system F family protein [Nocardioides cheoyonin]|uniref:type II secretion system F family protein n=1 Tax=Nocardioides cheoyonin TaxID=3156615 RepID=UPI0032B35030